MAREDQEEGVSGNVIEFPGAGVEPAEVSPELRAWLLQHYLAARLNGLGHSRALGGLQIVVDRGVVPESLGEAADVDVEAMADVEGWEGEYLAARSAPLLDARAVDLQARLEDLLRQVDVARGVLEQQTLVMEGPPPFGWSSRHGEVWPDSGAVLAWRSARNDWERLTERAAGLGERLQRLRQESLRGADYARTLESLRSEYSGGGPQYELLAEAVASVDARIKAMERSERDVPPEEYQKLSDLRLKYIAQLQRHTESLKSESIQPVQDAIKTLVETLEREIKPSNPSAWESIVRVIVQKVEEKGYGMRAAG